MPGKSAAFFAVALPLALANCSGASEPDHVANIEMPNGDPAWSETSDTTCAGGCSCPTRPTREGVTIDVRLEPDQSILVTARRGRAEGWWRYTEDPQRPVAAKSVTGRSASVADAALKLPTVVDGVLAGLPRADQCGYFHADQSLPFRDVMRLHSAASDLGFREVVGW